MFSTYIITAINVRLHAAAKADRVHFHCHCTQHFIHLAPHFNSATLLRVVHAAAIRSKYSTRSSADAEIAWHASRWMPPKCNIPFHIFHSPDHRILLSGSASAYRTAVSHAYDGRRQLCCILRLKLHRHDLLLYFFQTCLHSNCRQQISEVESEHQHARNVLITDIAVVMCFKQRSQRLLHANYTRCAARHGRFWVRKRRAVHRRQQITCDNWTTRNGQEYCI